MADPLLDTLIKGGGGMGGGVLLYAAIQKFIGRNANGLGSKMDTLITEQRKSNDLLIKMETNIETMARK